MRERRAQESLRHIRADGVVAGSGGPSQGTAAQGSGPRAALQGTPVHPASAAEEAYRAYTAAAAAVMAAAGLARGATVSQPEPDQEDTDSVDHRSAGHGSGSPMLLSGDSGGASSEPGSEFEGSESGSDAPAPMRSGASSRDTPHAESVAATAPWGPRHLPSHGGLRDDTLPDLIGRALGEAPGSVSGRPVDLHARETGGPAQEPAGERQSGGGSAREGESADPGAVGNVATQGTGDNRWGRNEGRPRRLAGVGQYLLRASSVVQGGDQVGAAGGAVEESAAARQTREARNAARQARLEERTQQGDPWASGAGAPNTRDAAYGGFTRLWTPAGTLALQRFGRAQSRAVAGSDPEAEPPRAAASRTGHAAVADVTAAAGPAADAVTHPAAAAADAPMGDLHVVVDLTLVSCKSSHLILGYRF